MGKWIGQLSSLERHIALDCPLYQLKCTKCNQQIQRYNLKRHKNECPEIKIACTYHKYGCDAKIKRKHMQKHLKDKELNHLKMKKKYKKKKKKVKKPQKKKKKKKKKKS